MLDLHIVTKKSIYILGFSCIGTFWVCWAMYSKMIFIFEHAYGDFQTISSITDNEINKE